MKHLSLALLISFFSITTFAQTLPADMPVCRDASRAALPIDNAGVLKLKTTTPNLFKKQVFVKAKLVSIGEIKNNSYGRHLRFIVTLADKGQAIAHENLIEISQSLNGYNYPTASDLSGVIYICGEYSTTDMNQLPRITKFEPSETGAMIHWTHAASRDLNAPSRHPHGWVYANGKIFGTYLR